jgi:hypothetical protein
VINRHPKVVKIPIFCTNCLYRKSKEDDSNLNLFNKEEWLCLGFEIVDPLDGAVSYHTCRKARKDSALCGAEGTGFKPRP